jgi:preprotein translocase subunit SecG
MLTVLIVIHLMIVMAMIGVVLLQRSEGGGLGVGQTGGFLSSRGTANVLTRTTAILATGFFLMSLALSVVAGLDRKPHSILQNTSGQPSDQAPSGGVLDQLKQQGQQPPQGPASQGPASQGPSSQGPSPQGQPPAPPSGPQVPRSK